MQPLQVLEALDPLLTNSLHKIISAVLGPTQVIFFIHHSQMNTLGGLGKVKISEEERKKEEKKRKRRKEKGKGKGKGKGKEKGKGKKEKGSFQTLILNDFSLSTCIKSRKVVGKECTFSTLFC